jgi:hypothetical protein
MFKKIIAFFTGLYKDIKSYITKNLVKSIILGVAIIVGLVGLILTLDKAFVPFVLLTVSSGVIVLTLLFVKDK